MDSESPFLAGTAAETGRAFWWRSGDETGGPLSATEILQRMGLPLGSELIEAAESWLAELPPLHTYDVLDLMYIEQRLGCWLGPLIYGETAMMYIAPFSNRTVFELMMELPYEYRREQQLAQNIIYATWPELLDFPFNPPPVTRRISDALELGSQALAKTPLLWRASRTLHRLSAKWR